jgi:hypothetical protein
MAKWEDPFIATLDIKLPAYHTFLWAASNAAQQYMSSLVSFFIIHFYDG